MKTTTLRHTVTIHAPAESVFAALAESRRHSAFTGSPARMPKKAGGEMTAYGGYITGKVLGLWKGRGLLQTWRTTEWPDGAEDSRLEIRLEELKSGIIKINPLVRWQAKDTYEYMMGHDLPLNPLFEQGYTSIGCAPCTRPVLAGEDERAGRWAGRGKIECGIHTAFNDPGRDI